MGRTPVREALLRLQKEGLIEIFPRKGMRVAPFNKKNVSDLYQARKLLEPTVMTSYLSMYAKSTLLDYLVRFENGTLADPRTAFRAGRTIPHLSDLHHPERYSDGYVPYAHGAADPPGYVRGVLKPRKIVRKAWRSTVPSSTRSSVRMSPDTRDSIILHLNHSLVSSLSAIQNI